MMQQAQEMQERLQRELADTEVNASGLNSRGGQRCPAKSR